MLPHERDEKPSHNAAHDVLPHRKHREMKPHEEIIEWLEAIYEKVKNIEESSKR